MDMAKNIPGINFYDLGMFFLEGIYRYHIPPSCLPYTRLYCTPLRRRTFPLVRCNHFSGTEYQVPGINYLVPGTWYTAVQHY